jgi:transposase-like protein
MLKNIRDVSRYLNDEKAAGALIETLRWPDGVVTCPLCDGLGKGGKPKPVYECTPPNADRKQWKCGACRKKFSVTSRSIFEGSHIRLGHWIYAIFKMCTSKKGISANQLRRELGIHYRSAWFLCHRVREAMTLEPLASMLGEGGGVVELDETFVGGRSRNNMHRNKGPEATKKAIVMTLIERDGEVRSVHVPNNKKGTLQTLAKPIVDRSANIVTDAHLAYEGLDEHFASHEVVDHSKTFVRGVVFHTNFAESYHSLLKRGIIGTFHHVSDKHLHRYLSEFDCRWNTRTQPDGERALQVIRSAPGRRLTYKQTVS